MKAAGNILLAAGLLAGCGVEPVTDTPGFDFQHVDLALEYFETGDEALLDEIAGTDAARHLKTHSDRTGYYDSDESALGITRDLLEDRPDQQTLGAVRALVEHAKGNQERIATCFSQVEEYLPENAYPTHPVYMTFGYDIGVSMDGAASLNLAHPRFLADREEIWFYCIHENHHAGVTQLHPMREVPSIKTARELLDFVIYSTFLEGTAVHAARAERARRGALGSDPDYVALGDEQRMEVIVRYFFASLDLLESEGDRELNDAHWSVIEAMSSGDRLWYRTGAHMAKVIEQARGREGLIEVIEAGPAAFFQGYLEALELMVSAAPPSDRRRPPVAPDRGARRRG